MVSKEVFRKRTERFQRLMRENGIDASMIRTLSSFTYFTGIKWLRPALLIPAEGDPTVFIFQYEAEEFTENSWIRNLKTYRKAEELMKAVSGTIRQENYKVVGFDYFVERDSYVLFFELFKKMNAQAENMALASVHAPLTIPKIGTVKLEDTYILKPKRAKKLTSFDYEITK